MYNLFQALDYSDPQILEEFKQRMANSTVQHYCVGPVGSDFGVSNPITSYISATVFPVKTRVITCGYASLSESSLVSYVISTIFLCDVSLVLN